MSPAEMMQLEVEMQEAMDTHLALRLFCFDKPDYFVEHMAKLAKGEILPDARIRAGGMIQPESALTIYSGLRLAHREEGSLWLVGTKLPGLNGLDCGYRYVLVGSYNRECDQATCHLLCDVREVTARLAVERGFTPREVVDEYAKYAVRNLRESEKRAEDFRLLVGAIAHNRSASRGMFN